MKKKCSFTLIEVMISVSIFMILAITLFTIYYSLLQSDKQGEILKKTACDRHRTYLFLKKNFTYLIFKNTKETPFYNDNETLFFTFNNGVDLSPDFSGVVNGKIYKKKNALIFEISPRHPKKIDEHNVRSQTLLSHVKQMEWEFFYHQPHPFTDPCLPSIGFHKNWKKEFRVLPKTLKLIINKDEIYPFILCTS